MAVRTVATYVRQSGRCVALVPTDFAGVQFKWLPRSHINGVAWTIGIFVVRAAAAGLLATRRAAVGGVSPEQTQRLR